MDLKKIIAIHERVYMYTLQRAPKISKMANRKVYKIY